MKIRLRNILLISIVSLSLSIVAGNFTTGNIENRFESSSISIECSDNSLVEVDLSSLEFRPDSIRVNKKIDLKDYDTTDTIKYISIVKKESSPKEEKITMFELLVKWIALLLEWS